ncbi:hypothetical protein Tco_0595855 [Tanacetum coccineum]
MAPAFSLVGASFSPFFCLSLSCLISFNVVRVLHALTQFSICFFSNAFIRTVSFVVVKLIEFVAASYVCRSHHGRWWFKLLRLSGEDFFWRPIQGVNLLDPRPSLGWFRKSNLRSELCHLDWSWRLSRGVNFFFDAAHFSPYKKPWSYSSFLQRSLGRVHESFVSLGLIDYAESRDFHALRGPLHTSSFNFETLHEFLNRLSIFLLDVVNFHWVLHMLLLLHKVHEEICF